MVEQNRAWKDCKGKLGAIAEVLDKNGMLGPTTDSARR